MCVRSPLANGIALSAGNHSGKHSITVRSNSIGCGFSFSVLGNTSHFWLQVLALVGLLLVNIMGLLIKVQPDLESEYGFDLLLQIVSAVVGM